MSEEIKDQTPEEIKSLKLEVLNKMTDLATAGFGLVAAIAWNDAIKALFMIIFPTTGTVIAQFVYAIIVTIIIVMVTIKLGKLTDVAKKTSLKINIKPNFSSFKKK
ncbi:MAG: DUF5654 family protein [Candidatus Buchananbacteria bacterium]|nr:DUF5654 family protein [Candidatus Buchananbacteria bacterium]